MLETMSQFASNEDLYKARALRFARALVDVMDGVEVHHVQDRTALSDEDCAQIIDARKDAREWLDSFYP